MGSILMVSVTAGAFKFLRLFGCKWKFSVVFKNNSRFFSSVILVLATFYVLIYDLLGVWMDGMLF